MLVLDANILIRGVLGSRVLGLLRKYAGQVEFMAPDLAFQETREHLPGILEARRIPAAPAMATSTLWPGWCRPSRRIRTLHAKRLPANASVGEMKTIGRF